MAAPDHKPKLQSTQSAVDQILELCALEFNYRVATIKNHSRNRFVLEARNIAMYLAHKHTGRSAVWIGRHFGGPAHTTALQAIRNITARLQVDQALREKVERIAEKLKA
jgi:chromosomal replication initiator protein